MDKLLYKWKGLTYIWETLDLVDTKFVVLSTAEHIAKKFQFCSLSSYCSGVNMLFISLIIQSKSSHGYYRYLMVQHAADFADRTTNLAASKAFSIPPQHYLQYVCNIHEY